ncbi:MAG: DeoR/GlpR family DNA-binding transcription regulator [Eubacteriales bacterium]|nr:DeoR/GlpR family DNA-binding transcription regulator [Eubacteriales bacterium]
MKISRLNAIEEYILSNKTAGIDELCDVFQVSKNTIRRDLSELEERGHIAKVYGGVTAIQPEDVTPLPVRSGINVDGKAHIGALAAQLVEDGDTIFLDSGSTTVCMLRHLTERHNVTVITHSLTAMNEAAKYDNLHLIALGGQFNSATSSFVGISALNSLTDLHISKAFMGATGVTVENGMSNTTFLEAEIKRSVVAHSSRVILMADHSKLGHEASISFCRLSNIVALVSDQSLPEKFSDYCRAHTVRVMTPENRD